MADVASLWKQALGVYQDKGRDGVPQGHVWDLIDYVPDILGAAIRGRGAWVHRSDALASPVDGMIYAQFEAGDKLLAVANTAIREIPTTGVAGSSSVGSSVVTKQNPVKHRDRIIIPAANGTSAAKILTWDGATYTITDAPVSALTGEYATVWKDRTILGNSDAEPQRAAFSKPGDPTTAWDNLSLVDTSLPLTGLAAQRNQILAFHGGSVERIRGTTPPDSTATDPTGDLVLDTIFDRAGCFDARSIAYWYDNVIFCDARGVHITDGAIVRNMAAQGGWATLWRSTFADALTVAGTVVRDSYMVTVRRSGGDPVTYIVDIPSRRMYRFGNIDSRAYAFSVGSEEKIYATDTATNRVIDVSPTFDPDSTILQTDGDGTNVLPVMETGHLRIGKEEGMQRFVDLFATYETGSVADDGTAALRIDMLRTPSDTTYEEVGTLRRSTDQVRRKLPVGMRSLGIALKVTALIALKDIRLYGIGASGWAEEEGTL